MLGHSNVGHMIIRLLCRAAILRVLCELLHVQLPNPPAICSFAGHVLAASILRTWNLSCFSCWMCMLASPSHSFTSDCLIYSGFCMAFSKLISFILRVLAQWGNASEGHTCVKSVSPRPALKDLCAYPAGVSMEILAGSIICDKHQNIGWISVSFGPNLLCTSEDLTNAVLLTTLNFFSEVVAI